jgi:FkbM family methyltransferase
MAADEHRELAGWKRTLHYKLRFGLSKLPFFPVRYRLRTPGLPDVFFYWTHVIPFMNPMRGAFDFELYGWDVRELRFLYRYLTPGMTFLDLGAHHGLYSILAAKCFGNASGRILAFEPAPAVRRRLHWHRRINRARRLEIHPYAVGASRGSAELYIPHHGIDTVGSLRPPGTSDGATRRVSVERVTLDEFAPVCRLSSVDLIKLDVEGAEIDVINGSVDLIKRHRPLWLFEALDATSAAWGSSGRALVERFIALDHAIFEFEPDGWLSRHEPRSQYPLDSNCNLLAVPKSKSSSVASLVVANGFRAPAS